ncbi:hypothetical protein GH714_040605 [Hevea brasiliensis]|uniref:HAT C-terminal dimerisation domain-containing protein n=1 Tax=Hevea brasiliensis TaxID=3981 RepID=A0A6A6L587_HEVBR|nr:hypothetical protein GH714_040605 [Hevea brasiliensis]
MDGEVSTERIKCFRRIFSNEDERIRANDEFANFSLKTGPFADPDSIGSMYVTDPRKWWACFGSNAPLLQRLAFKVLGQPTSSSCCERNWSIYSFIHSCRRNKLTPKRAEDLVFIHNNLRLLSRNSSQYYDEKTKLWDVGGDQFGSMEDVGVLEFANLSLDEPELESVLFDENATTSIEKENEKDSEVEEMSFFWVGGVDVRKIHLVKRESLLKPKHKGGLGVCNSLLHNKALPFKLLWWLQGSHQSSWVSVLQSKYHFSYDSGLLLTFDNHVSMVWKDIQSVASTNGNSF